MTLRDYLLILRRRWLLVVSCLAIVLAATLAVNFVLLPKQYTGSAQLLVAGGKTSTDQNAVLSVGTQRVQSYAALANSRGVASQAVQEGNLGVSPSTLQGRISASVPTDSQLVDLHV